MNTEILYLLLRTSLTATLSDREAFINRVAALITQHTDRNPAAARQLGNHVAVLLAALKTSLPPRPADTATDDKQLAHTLRRLADTLERLDRRLADNDSPHTTPNDSPLCD
ncbi:MAG: hypothetical protein RR397_03885 [Odoribacter sp.]